MTKFLIYFGKKKMFIQFFYYENPIARLLMLDTVSNLKNTRFNESLFSLLSSFQSIFIIGNKLIFLSTYMRYQNHKIRIMYSFIQHYLLTKFIVNSSFFSGVCNHPSASLKTESSNSISFKKTCHYYFAYYEYIVCSKLIKYN